MYNYSYCINYIHLNAKAEKGHKIENTTGLSYI